MDGFTIVDGVVAGVIVVSAILAYSRGLVRELMAIVGWVAAAILAYIFAPQAEPLVKELPYVGEFLRGSCELSVIAAFSSVFALALLVVSLFTPLFSTVVQRSALGGVDQAAGFVYGAIRGILLVAVALVVYDKVVVTGKSVVRNSITEPGEYSSGTPLTDNRTWRKNAARFKQLDTMARKLGAISKEKE